MGAYITDTHFLVLLTLSIGVVIFYQTLQLKIENFKAVNKDKVTDVPAQSDADAILCSSTPSTSIGKQLTLSEEYGRKVFQDVYNTKAQKYHYLIAEIIAIDTERLSFVERTGIIRLLE